MRMEIQQWGSPRGTGYTLKTGGKTVEDRRLVFGEDVAERREDAAEELPFAEDVIQNVIDEHNITNAVFIPMQFRDMLSDIHVHERTFTPPKGKAVWFPVENGIEVTDPYSTAADPAMGYVKSVDEKDIIEIDVRQVYKRTKAPNIADESRKMEPLGGVTYVEGKYCFENRKECMDYIIAQSDQGSRDPIFHADIIPQLSDEDLMGLTETSSLEQ